MKNICWVIILGGLSFSQFSCKKKQDRIGEIIHSPHVVPIEQVKNEVLKTGDGKVYDALCISYLRERHFEEYLVYSLYMANKYKYPRAYYYVYYCITSMYEKNHIPIDEESKKMALNYLEKGVELNDINALNEYGELLMEGKYMAKDTVLSKKIFERAENEMK